MSRRAELDQRLARLGEISDILTAMKNMALIETRKFIRFMAHQQRLVDSLGAAAADFLHFFPTGGPGPDPDRCGPGHILILIGSERGFCGDFNETIAAALAGHPLSQSPLIVVGRRLAGKLEGHPRILAALPGANVAEEVPPLLDRLIEELHRLAGDEPMHALSVLAHEPDGAVITRQLLPITAPGRPGGGSPPRLHEAPAAFFQRLTEHYLAAQLPALFYGSLMAENRRRLEHMNGALNRIGNKMDDLVRRRNALRQEEITEQIEIILLSVDVMNDSCSTTPH